MPDSNRSPLDNPISNTGLKIINGRKYSAAAKSHKSSLYQNGPNAAPEAIRSQFIAFEPCYTYADAEYPEDGATEVPILTALNGFNAKNSRQVDAAIIWMGFIRGETANEHVVGNANGAVPIITGGVLSVVNTGIASIKAGSLVRLRAPTEEEARLQIITGRTPGKVIGLTEMYIPEFDDMDANNCFVTLMQALGVRLAARFRNPSPLQVEAFTEWWEQERITFALFEAHISWEFEMSQAGGSRTMADKNARDVYKNWLASLGVGAKSGANKTNEFQIRLLKRLFMKRVNEAGVVEADMYGQAFFPTPEPGRGVLGADENAMTQWQAGAVQKKFTVIIGAHAEKQGSIIGRAPNGAEKSQQMDLIFWGCK